MGTIKKGLVFAVVFLAVALFSLEAQAEKKIGVLMLSDEPRYSDALKGIQDKLREEGFGDQKVTLTIENAEGNKAKVAEAVRKFAAAKPDLIIAMGTTAAIAFRKEIKDVPTVFCIVYDPIAAGIALDWKSSGNNTTGTSTKIPMSALMDMLSTFGRVKKLAVLYTPNEKNTELQLQDLQEIEKKYPFKMIPVRLTSEEVVKRLIPEVFRTTDAAYLTGSNLVNSQVPVIVDIARKNKVITISHLDDLVVKGVLMGMCANSYSAGQLAGQKVVMILKGAKPSSIPIEVPKKYDVLLNKKTAQEGQFKIPSDFMKRVTKTIE